LAESRFSETGHEALGGVPSEIAKQFRGLSPGNLSDFSGSFRRDERRAFTLIEVVVALGILVMVVGFAGVIFQRSIGSYRTSMAQAEIMRKLRVITEQLDSDFRGLRKDAPMYIQFEKGTNPVYDTNNRFDQIMFFADGDFQGTSSNPVVGNVARIYYGQANNPNGLPGKNRILARRQHILTSDTGIDPAYRWPRYPNFNDFDACDIPYAPTLRKNDTYEYDWLSLSQWQAIVNDPTYGSTNAAQVVATCFNNRPVINIADASTIHNLMTEGIGSFSIQWDYIARSNVTPAEAHFWWPALDPDGNGDMSDNDFVAMGSNFFGFYFYSAPPGGIWSLPDGATGYYYPDNTPLYPRPAYPKALKFVFTIYDSRGVFPNGQTFSHIVYIGD
jgi:prepilin-type N-terminal cleavage/methylation domain-containing protein